MPIGIPIPILYLRELLRSELTYLLTYDFLLTFHSNHGLLTSHCHGVMTSAYPRGREESIDAISMYAYCSYALSLGAQ